MPEQRQELQFSEWYCLYCTLAQFFSLCRWLERKKHRSGLTDDTPFSFLFVRRAKQTWAKTNEFWTRNWVFCFFWRVSFTYSRKSHREEKRELEKHRRFSSHPSRRCMQFQEIPSIKLWEEMLSKRIFDFFLKHFQSLSKSTLILSILIIKGKILSKVDFVHFRMVKSKTFF